MHAAATDLRKTIHVKMHEEKIGGFLDLQILKCFLFICVKQKQVFFYSKFWSGTIRKRIKSEGFAEYSMSVRKTII